MKQVTVLFCDIVNSTGLAESLGPEAMHDLLNAFLEASIAEVRRYGGVAPQFTGDGFMALFGAPVAHEDHVRRALLAAVAIRRSLTDGSEGAYRRQFNLTIRIGIHTGPVVFGPIGDNLPIDYTVIGDTANVAARLQQAADPGTILISETTRLIAQGYTRVDPIGQLTLKGKEQPISAHRLLGVSRRRSALDDATSARLTTFVGRAGEMSVLNDSLRQVVSGRGKAIGIVGEPGMGKSRLLAEFRRQLAEGSVTWIEGRCVSYSTAIPYSLVLDLLRSNFRIVEADAPEAITEKVGLGLQELGMDPDQDSPILLHLLGIKGFGSLPELLNPESIKPKAFEIFRQLSMKGSGQHPLVLVLENLHWLDKISEEFLGLLAESIPTARIFMLSTYRPGYHPPWMDKSYAGQVPLAPLSRDDSLSVLRSVLRGERLADELTEEIVTKADGNPFFLEQLALHAEEEGGRRSDLMVPNTIHDVVMARIDRLPDRAKQALQTAAVIGREFTLHLLQAVWKDAGPLEPLMRELSRLEFVYERVETEGSMYVFRHALTRETAYGSLLERRRRACHGAVGEALEDLYRGRTDEVAEVLAMHFGRSEEADKAVDYAISAAEKAQRRWANSEALTYFTDALSRLEKLPDTQPNRLRRVDAVLKQAEVKFALGRQAEHIENLERIRYIVENIDDVRRRATWHYWTGFLHSMTGQRLDLAIGHCQEAVTLASAGGLDEIKASAEACLAQAYVSAGRLRDAVEAGESALSSFEARGTLWWAGRALLILSLASNALGDWEASLAYCRRVLEHGISLKDLRLKAVGWLRMGTAYIHQGDFDRGLECCNEALALEPIPYDSAMARAARGYANFKTGRVDIGITELSEAVAWFERSHLSYTHLRFAVWLAEAHLWRGDSASALPLIEHILSTSRQMGYPYLEGVACWLMADFHANDGPAAAEDYVDTAMRILEEVDARNDLARAMVTKAALRRTVGDVANARQLLNQAYAIFEQLGTRDEPARVKSALAALNSGSATGASVTSTAA